jgi:hypothetical protein
MAVRRFYAHSKIPTISLMPSIHHIGKSGHLAVMAELANRGYNVAMPEIDIGDDIFAVNDANGNMWRLQVKTSIATQRIKTTTGQFRVRHSAIVTAMVPELHFVFTLRLPDRFRFVVINRAVLSNYVQHQNVGSASVVKGTQWVNLYISLNNATGAATCSGTVFTQHLEDWNTWPVL